MIFKILINSTWYVPFNLALPTTKNYENTVIYFFLKKLIFIEKNLGYVFIFLFSIYDSSMVIMRR